MRGSYKLLVGLVRGSELMLDRRRRVGTRGGSGISLLELSAGTLYGFGERLLDRRSEGTENQLIKTRQKLRDG